MKDGFTNRIIELERRVIELEGQVLVMKTHIDYTRVYRPMIVHNARQPSLPYEITYED